MNNLVAPGSRRLGCIDGGENRITHVTGQAFIRQASDPLALLRTLCLSAELQVDATIKVVPEQAHLHVQP